MTQKIKKAHLLTLRLLEKLGNRHPNYQQITLAESLLFRIIVDQKLGFPKKLSEREVSCLLLAAKGKTIAQTADILSVKSSTIRTWRRNILSKLNCSSVTQAVFEGIQYGLLTPKDPYPDP